MRRRRRSSGRCQRRRPRLDALAGALLLIDTHPFRAQLLREFRDARLGLGRGALQADVIDTRSDDRDTNDALQTFVEGGADDDISVLIDLFADPGGRLVDLVERQVLAAGDRDEQALRPFHRGIVDQRI